MPPKAQRALRPLVEPPKRPQAPPTALPIRVRRVGRIEDEPLHTTLGTHPPDCMLTMIVSGQGWYLCRGKRTQVQAGLMGLVFPDEDPGILMADPEDPYVHYYCRFAGHLAVKIARRIRRERGEQRFFRCPDIEGIVAVMEAMCAWREPHSHSYLTDEAATTPCEGLLLHLLARLGAPPPVAAPGPRITRTTLRRYLYDHLAEPFDLQRAARHFNVTPSHLARVAKRHLGQPLGKTAAAVKLEWAQLLLREPALSVSEIATRVGYLDPLYFSKVFRQQYGQSPAKWRKLIFAETDLSSNASES